MVQLSVIYALITAWYSTHCSLNMVKRRENKFSTACAYWDQRISVHLSRLDHITDCVKALECYQGICCLAFPLNVRFPVEFCHVSSVTHWHNCNPFITRNSYQEVSWSMRDTVELSKEDRKIQSTQMCNFSKSWLQQKYDFISLPCDDWRKTKTLYHLKSQMLK